MDFHIFLYIGILLIAALLSTRLMKIFKLPNVTGYIITGIIMGPFVFGLFFNHFTYDGIKTSVIYNFVDQIKWVSTIALGFIAFSIGTSFKASAIKAVGKKVLVITILEALLASVFVIIALMIAHFIAHDKISWQLVLVLGAIASATAPAATLMVIKQYNAKGPLVNTLLPVVALDDAVALILFAILFQIASALSVGGTFDVYKMIFKPIIEILISLGIGAVFGIVISLLNKVFKSRNNRVILAIFAIFSCCGLYFLFRADYMGGFELSSLLMCMMAGALYTNLFKNSGPTLDVLDRFTPPIYLLFFVISGASLDLTIFFNDTGLLVVIIAAVYIVSRVAGKYSGARIGAKVSHAEESVQKYLGFALVPQAGVAIGLATTASNIFTDGTGALIVAIVLTSTLVYELIGPACAKFAFKKAGEIE